MTAAEKLAKSLEALEPVQGKGVLRSDDLPRLHRERLSKAGFLEEVHRGWWIVTQPATYGTTTAWYVAFWTFIAAYLNHRFGNDYCLSAESSLLLHAGNTIAPQQVVAMVTATSSNTVELPHGTSLVCYHERNFPAGERVQINGLWVMSLPYALIKAPRTFFERHPKDAEIALRMVRDPAPILRILLAGGNSTIAGRLAGAYEFLGEAANAYRIVKTMADALVTVRKENPFQSPAPLLSSGSRLRSPYVGRIEAMWAEMRPGVLSVFPAAPGAPANVVDYLVELDEIYVNDAYNSLSIEGYRVTRELIEKIRDGKWNPDVDKDDQGQKNALAAKGYNEAFKAVKESIQRILKGESAARVTETAHHDWFREMFGPQVTAGILKEADLAGYRNQQVYIRGSQHVPLPNGAILDAIETLFQLLEKEEHAGVRAVLGHFIFVFIHPYMDGNGRLGRFLMNTMLASGGYPWTVIRHTRRTEYLRALETASVDGNIVPFADFVRDEMMARGMPG